MDEITLLQAETLRTLANPTRLEILHRLAVSSATVTELATWLRLSQPNVSQHLATLRAAGLVAAERDGRLIHYRLVDPEVMVACGVMRRVLERHLARLGGLALGSSPTGGPTWTNP